MKQGNAKFHTILLTAAAVAADDYQPQAVGDVDSHLVELLLPSADRCL
jgi:hypothetical protein